MFFESNINKDLFDKKHFIKKIYIAAIVLILTKNIKIITKIVDKL